MSKSAANRPEYTDFNCRHDDDVWRRAQVIWYWLAIPVPPGQNAIYIANIARVLTTYNLAEREAEKVKDAQARLP